MQTATPAAAAPPPATKKRSSSSSAAAAAAMPLRTKFHQDASGAAAAPGPSFTSRRSSGAHGTSSHQHQQHHHHSTLPPPPRLSSDAAAHHHQALGSHHHFPYVMRPLSFHRQPSASDPTQQPTQSHHAPKFSFPAATPGNTIYSPRQAPTAASERSTSSHTPITHPRRSFISSNPSSAAIPFAKTAQSGGSQQHHHQPPSHPSSSHQHYPYGHHQHQHQRPVSQSYHSQHTHAHHPHHSDHDSQQLSHATTARALGFALPVKSLLPSMRNSGDFVPPAWALSGERTSHGHDEDVGMSSSRAADQYVFEQEEGDHDGGDDQFDSLSGDDEDDHDVEPRDEANASSPNSRKRKRRLSNHSHKHAASASKEALHPSSGEGSKENHHHDGTSNSAASKAGKEGKRTRVPQACDLCRKRKARCLNGRPIGAQNPNDPGAKCDRCVKQNAECVWSFFSDAGRQATAARKKAGLHNDVDGDEDERGAHGKPGGGSPSSRTPGSSQDSLLLRGSSLSPSSVSQSKRAAHVVKRRKLSSVSPPRHPRRKTLDVAAREAEVKNEGMHEQQADSQSQDTQGISVALAGALDLHPDSQDVRPQPVTMEFGVPSTSMSPSIPTPRQIVSDGMGARSASSAGSKSDTTSLSPVYHRGTRPSATSDGVDAKPAAQVVLPSQRARNDILAHLDPVIQRRLRRLRRKSESAIRDMVAEERRRASGSSSGGAGTCATAATARAKSGSRRRRNTIGVPTASDLGALTYVEGVYLSPTLSSLELEGDRHSSDETDGDGEGDRVMADVGGSSSKMSALPTRPYLDWSAESKLDWLLSGGFSMLRCDEPDGQGDGDLALRTTTAPRAMSLVDVAVSSQEDGNSASADLVAPVFAAPSGGSSRLETVVKLMDRVYSGLDEERAKKAAAVLGSGRLLAAVSSQASYGSTADRPPTDSQIGEIFDLADAGMASQQSQSYSLPQSQSSQRNIYYPHHSHHGYGYSNSQGSLRAATQANHLPLSQTSTMNLTQEYYGHQQSGPGAGGVSGSRLGRAAPFGRVISFGQSQWGSGILGGPETEFESVPNGAAGGASNALPASQMSGVVVAGSGGGTREDERMMELSQSDDEGGDGKDEEAEESP